MRIYTSESGRIYTGESGRTEVCVGDISRELTIRFQGVRVEVVPLSPADMRSLAADLNETADKKEFGS